MYNSVKPYLKATGRLNRLAVAAHLAFCLSCSGEDLPIGNFGSTNFGDWMAAGTAFNLGPASDGLLPKLEIENARDNRVASSEMEGDRPTGTLTSPEFEITRKYISFLISGGNYEHDTCLNLLINGKVVKSATGWRSDRLAPASWEVSRFLGQKAQLQIVDQASGDWGHINVDQMVQTDKPERLPVVTEPLYQESLRPQFHFTARQWTMDRLNPGPKEEGWLNDLNGLIYYDGEYHLFAQRWWKCWLHAVSRDLVHWQELEPAFWEEQSESGDQSGTCVVDYNNTSGLSPNKETPPMVAFWSRNDNRTHCICYTLDHGRTWKRYEKNPIMIFPERDPKVFWYAPGNHWVMMLYGNSQYHIFTSTNLLNWKDEQKPIPDSFECPDFFELALDGNPGNKKWVLIQGNGKYSVGTFSGTEFKEETARYACDVGPNFYATQTWGNTETGDGRRIQAAWMRSPSFPEMPFNQQVTFPCELTLRSTPNGPRIFRQPIREIALLHMREDKWTNRTLNANQVLPLEPSGQLFHIQAEINISAGAKLTFNIRGIPLVLTSKSIESGTRPVPVADQVKTVDILVDRASIEAFVNQGEISSTRFVLPKENGMSVKAEGGPVTIESLAVHPLESAWTSGTSKPRIVNIYNFVRNSDYRVPNSEEVLYETTRQQIQLIKPTHLPATWALQYDALINPRYQKLFKEQLGSNDEIAAWWEIPQPLAEKAGIKWRGRHEWDSTANIGFAPGYTPAERCRLVDVYMADFKAIFGYYPLTVGSWYIDEVTLAYMAEHYGIVASCNCKDQVGTDGYTLWGGYWNQAYYPSRRNAYMPAQTRAAQLEVPIFRMLGSDPIYQYGNSPGMFTLEPVYPRAGGSADWVGWFMKNLIQQPALAFGYTQAGQENSFGWAAMEKGLILQVALLAQQAEAGEIQVRTLAQAGQWFREHYSLTPATAVICLDDWKHENRKTVWYDSRFYRLNVLWENGAFFIRDLHRFDENVASATHDTALTTTFLAYGTLPVMDGALWSGTEKAGIWPVLLSADGGKSSMLPEGPPVVKELNLTDLSIRQPLRSGGSFSMVCNETNVTFTGVDGQGQPLRWAWELVGGARQKSAVQSITRDSISYHYDGVDYQLRLSPDGGSCEPLASGAVRLNSNRAGNLVLVLGGF